MPFVTPDRNRHQYIVGIDFGHGETSAAIAQIDWDSPFDKLGKPFDVEFTGGRSAIFSCFVQNISDKSIVHIGNKAYQYAHLVDPVHNDYKWDFHAYFKDKPSELRKNGQLDVMKTFMKSVYDEVLKIKGGEGGPLTKDNHLVYIACPSSSTEWSESEVHEYAVTASDAGLPLCYIEGFTNGIIRESRAAFLCARSQRNMTVNGILIVDFGSSTVDFTYYSSNLPKPIDDGEKLGAQKIEALILDDISNAHEDVKVLCNSDRVKKSLLLSIRQAKEDYYKNDGVDDLVVNINLQTLTGRPDARKVSLFYSPFEIETMSKIEAYKVEIKKAFERFKAQHLNGKKVMSIFLTGGASRMGWVKDIALSVFGDGEEVAFPKEVGDCSTTISRGIAMAGRADVRTILFEESLPSDYISIPTDFEEKIIEDAAKDFSLAAYEVIKKNVLAFKDASSNYSIATLKEWIKDALKQMSLDSFVIKSYETETRKHFCNYILPKINQLIHEYSSPNVTIKLTKTSTLSGSTITNLSTSVDGVSDICFEAVKDELPIKFIKGVVNAIYTGVNITRNVCRGIYNLGGTIFGDKDFKEVDYVSVDDWIRFTSPKTILDANKRNRVYDAFTAAENKIKYRIELDVRRGNTTTVKEQITKAFKKDIESFIKSSIKEARLMFD